LGFDAHAECIRQPDGVVTLEKKHATQKLGELMRTWSPSRVILRRRSISSACQRQAA